jgi:hypothetical protein
MMRPALATFFLKIACVSAGFAGVVHGQALLDQTSIVAATGVAAASEFSFTATTAEALVVTLKDVQTPAAFQSLQIAVTLGDTLVGQASVDGTTGVTSASISLPAATGNYKFHVIGTPTNSGFGSFGSFSVCTAPVANPAACITADSYSDNIQTPAAAASNNTSQINTTFTSTVAGSYAVSLVDDQFPVALQTSLTVAGIALGSTPIAGPINPGTTPTQVTLAAGTNYSLLVHATADASVQAGLYSIKITDPSGKAVFARTLPVGQLAGSTVVQNPAAQSLNLTVNDLNYPAALSSLGIAVSAGGALLGDLTASGSTTIAAAPAGTLELWQYVAAGSQPGSYSVNLASSSGSIFSTTQVVNQTVASAPTSFAFVVALPAAGTYSVAVTDFEFPAQLGSLTYTVAQDGAALGVTGGNFTASAAGTAIVVVNATPAQNSLGVFGVTVSSTGSSPTALLDQTQAVGGAFNTTTINLGTSGDYNVTLTDLKFPSAFTDLAVVVTQNGTIFGKIYGGGSFPIAVTPGKYVVTFVATPGAENYGLYSVNISSNSPVVTLTVTPTSVSSGQSVEVSWTSSNATSCTASGAAAFTGNVPLSSTGTAVAVTATSTLGLSCTGPGGSTTAPPVTVTVSTSGGGKSSSSGGGAFDWYSLGVLAVLSGVKMRRSRQRNSRPRSVATLASNSIRLVEQSKRCHEIACSGRDQTQQLECIDVPRTHPNDLPKRGFGQAESPGAQRFQHARMLPPQKLPVSRL